ncbi:MAG: MFS transporter [Acetobacteraceae bacterium]|nr:MAG: MFS transporter [Acetobacteraceae bacterium]
MTSAKRRIWGWYFFDWASQPYNTLLLTFIFGPYFAEVARGYYMGAGLEEEAAKAAAQSLWGFWYACFSLIIACLAPVLGAVAQGTGRRLVWVWLFSALYVIGAWSLWYVAPGAELDMLRRGAILFGIGLIGMEFATIFTNALIPSLAEGDDIGRVSGSGFAFGYLGGLVALAIMLSLFVTKGDSEVTYVGLTPILGYDPESQISTRAVGPFTAIWFMVFMIPFALWVREPHGGAGSLHVGRALASLRETLRSLKYRRSLSAYLCSALAYSDALTGIYAFGGVYASNVLNWDIGKIGVFGILGGLTAMVASWIGGHLDARFGPNTTPDRATEAFGLFALSGKVTSFVAPALITLATAVTGSARLGISPIILLFLVGLVLLLWVHPKGEMPK